MAQNNKTIKKAKQATKTNRHSKMSRSLCMFLWINPKKKKTVIKVAIIAIIVVTMAGLIPLPYTFSKSSTIPYSIDNKKDASLELGDSKVLSEGYDGNKIIIVSSRRSLWGNLFDWPPIQQKEVSSTITKKPVNKVIANGIRRYQYMLCSDGGYRYYTNEEFKDENTGFTSKDQDYCRENNQGYRIGLSDAAPSNVEALSVGGSTNTAQPNTYEADKINREVKRLKWCNEQDKKISDEYIRKVQHAQAIQGIPKKSLTLSSTLRTGSTRMI